MNHDKFVDYLGATSLRCRALADTASDMEAAEALRRVAEDMEAARSALSDEPVDSVAPDERRTATV